MIGYISNFARGVGKKAEGVFAFFGHTLSPTTRNKLFNQLTDNDQDGRGNNTSVRKRQCRLFRSAAAIICTYDNYQKGMMLQKQRGKHLSAFFKGTHKCTHKVFPFTDRTFDDIYAYYLQHNQDIPSPWDMPTFELISADFFLTYDKYVCIYPAPQCCITTYLSIQFVFKS